MSGTMTCLYKVSSVTRGCFNFMYFVLKEICNVVKILDNHMCKGLIQSTVPIFQNVPQQSLKNDVKVSS